MKKSGIGLIIKNSYKAAVLSERKKPLRKRRGSANRAREREVRTHRLGTKQKKQDWEDRHGYPTKREKRTHREPATSPHGARKKGEKKALVRLIKQTFSN